MNRIGSDIGMHCGVVQVQSFYNYGPLTVALAVNYMDRFLSRHHLPVRRGFVNILFVADSVLRVCVGFCVGGFGSLSLRLYVLQQGKDWMLQLLSVAGMSLAAKMEESEVPILLDFQVGWVADCVLEGNSESAL
jgi:cyclin D1/2/4